MSSGGRGGGSLFQFRRRVVRLHPVLRLLQDLHEVQTRTHRPFLKQVGALRMRTYDIWLIGGVAGAVAVELFAIFN